MLCCVMETAQYTCMARRLWAVCILLVTFWQAAADEGMAFFPAMIDTSYGYRVDVVHGLLEAY